MKFPRKLFLRFIKNLHISSKEEGLRPLFPLLGTQQYFLDEVIAGLEAGIHCFLANKGRQQGITTICLALDLFFLALNKGMHGLLIADSEKNRNLANTNLKNYLNSLTGDLFIETEGHNKFQLSLRNGSLLMYQVSGKSMGRGAGVSFVHATECSSWKDQRGLASLMASLAEVNPMRFYVFESTPLGFNMWHEMCEQAKNSLTQKYIFIGWWRNQYYSCPKGSPLYEHYWDGHLTADERDWSREVKKLYGVEIQPEQFAWYRSQLEEKYMGEVEDFHQEHPPTEERGWILSGAQWFHTSPLTDAFKAARKQVFESFRYQFGDEFWHTLLMDASPRNVELKIWEHPEPNGVYVVGGDPAYGSSDWADNFVVQVFRCYADRLVQVAEYASSDCSTYKFAWICAHLAGVYRNARLIIEINGPGQAVFDELKNLQRQAYSKGIENVADKDIFRKAVGAIRHYFYRRPDSISGSVAYQWRSTHDAKIRMLNIMRDCFTRGQMVMRSTSLLDEMKTICRTDDSDVRAEGRGKDDRVMAAAFACQAWFESERPQMMIEGRTFLHEMAAPKEAPEETVMNNLLKAHFNLLGVK